MAASNALAMPASERAGEHAHRLRWLIAPAWILGGALVLWLVFGGFANYDAAYSLVWGRDLAEGRLPDFGVALTPTPHPLTTLAGLLLAPLSPDAAEGVLVAIGFLALAALGYLVYRLGATWFGWPIGLLAAAIILTREPVLSYGARAYLDLPFAVLCLTALLIEARRTRAGWPVLALLAAAGLLRPEAWLFSLVYLGWLALPRTRPRAELAGLALLAVAAPALWLLTDLVLAHDALYSFTGTRTNTALLERSTGIGEVPTTLPRRLGEVLREPVVAGAIAGVVLALGWLRGRATLLLAACVLALGAYAIGGIGGVPLLTRYLLLAGALCSLLCAIGALGWRDLERGSRLRRAWIVVGALVLLALVAFVPAQVERLGSLRDSIALQERIRADLHAVVETPAFAAASRCGPTAVPNHRPVPQLSLWLDRPPRAIVTAQTGRPRTGVFIAPATAEVEEQFLVDRRDPERLTAPPPPGFRAVGGNRSWRLFARCAG